MSDFKLSIERYLKEQSLIPTIENLASMKPVSGGTINDAFLVRTAEGSQFFVKRHLESASFDKSACIGMFQAEVDGLIELRKTKAIRVPKPIGVGELSN
ncbi:hypothetical protein EV175_007213, partial [Coemansia sp. RSA 1933]